MTASDDRNPFRRLRDELDSETFASLPEEARDAINHDVDELAGDLLENARLAAQGERMARELAAAQASPAPAPGTFGNRGVLGDHGVFGGAQS